MKRRQFMKSVAAAAATPMLPAKLASAAPVSAAAYAKATEIARNGAYLSSTYLKFALGLDDVGSRDVVRRLVADGLVGEDSKNGLIFSKVFFSEHAKIVKLAMKASVSSQAGVETGEGMLDKAGDLILENEPDDLDVADEASDAPDPSETAEEEASDTGVPQ